LNWRDSPLLASKGILKSWKWELEIVSRNLVYEVNDKGYDALAEIVVGDVTKTLGIEFERTLKGVGRYEELRRVFNAERSVDTDFISCTELEILYLLAVELRDVRKRIGFALSKSFQADLLDADILSNSSAGEVISFATSCWLSGARQQHSSDISPLNLTWM